MNFADALRNWSAPEKIEHPCLYFSRADIPALRDKAEACPVIFGAIKDKGDEAVAKSIEDYSGERAEPEIDSAVPQLAFLYAITGEARYAERAKELIWSILARKKWLWHGHEPGTVAVDLRVAAVALTLALAYDWMGDSFSDDERERVKTALLERAVIPYHNVVRDRSEWWTLITHNWRSVICGEVGIATLCMADEYPDYKPSIELSIEGVLATLDAGGCNGGWDEGVGYWGYGIGRAVHFADILQRQTDGAVDIMEHPYLKITGDFGLYCATPDGMCFTFSDCPPHTPMPHLVAKLASHYRNPHWQWQARRKPPNDIFGFLWYDPDLADAPPADLPGAKHFSGIDVAAMHSGWGTEDEIFVGFKSGRTSPNHSHLDINSFVCTAYGKPLVKDLGTWGYDHPGGYFVVEGPRWDYEGNSTIGHNTILVEGRGQRYGDEHCGTIVAFYGSDAYDYAVSEASKAYGPPLVKFLRYLVFLKPDCVIVLDDVEADVEVRVEAMVHYEKEIEKVGAGKYLIKN
ncbi:MAG: heparinase II/III family protein, partial [Phycisphaerae bacterium]|nr:heparinase II/III family protein [Phycisphaerae bacterium]